MPHHDEPRWGITQVAQYLAVPVETLYQWRKHDYGPRAARIGRHLRYDPDGVREFFRTQQQAA